MPELPAQSGGEEQCDGRGCWLGGGGMMHLNLSLSGDLRMLASTLVSRATAASPRGAHRSTARAPSTASLAGSAGCDRPAHPLEISPPCPTHMSTYMCGHGFPHLGKRTDSKFPLMARHTAQQLFQLIGRGTGWTQWPLCSVPARNMQCLIRALQTEQRNFRGNPHAC